MMQQFSPKQKFKEFSSSFPQNSFSQGLFKHPWSPKLNSRAFQGLQGVARTLKLSMPWILWENCVPLEIWRSVYFKDLNPDLPVKRTSISTVIITNLWILNYLIFCGRVWWWCRSELCWMLQPQYWQMDVRSTDGLWKACLWIGGIGRLALCIRWKWLFTFWIQQFGTLRPSQVNSKVFFFHIANSRDHRVCLRGGG